MEKLHMKFSALNVDFDSPSLDFLGSRKPAHEGIKERYSHKINYFTIVGQSFVKTIADRHGHPAVTTSTSDELSVVSMLMTLKGLEVPEYRVFIDFCDLRLQRTLQE